jgi:ATP-dependent DNA ligase
MMAFRGCIIMNRLSAYVQKNAMKAIKGDVASLQRQYGKKLVVQPKVDGTRVFLFSTGGKVVLATKHNGVYEASEFPELFKGVRIVDNTVLDGELVKDEQRLYLFDILWLANRDCRQFPLLERLYMILDALVPEESDPLFYFHITGEKVGQSFEYRISVLPSIYTESVEKVNQTFKRYVDEGYEGVVVKAAMARYGAPNSWIKIKKKETIDMIILSIKESDGYLRTGEPWTWNVGLLDDNGNVVEMGSVSSCVAGVEKAKIQPGTIVEVEAQEVTKGMKLRHPVIVRIRDDLTKDDCKVSEQLFGGL